MIEEYQSKINTKLISYDQGDVPGDFIVSLFGMEDGEWEFKKSSTNDGIFMVAYPEGFVGESHLQVRDADDNVMDEGVIKVGTEE